MWSWIKFVSGFDFTNPEKIGKVVYVLVIASALVGVYHKVFVARTTSSVDRSTSTATFAGATINTYVAKQVIEPVKEKTWYAEVGVGALEREGTWSPNVEVTIGKKF